ncbi:MAG: DUF1254 domain-containing protein [Pseudoxanthomonas sp.]
MTGTPSAAEVYKEAYIYGFPMVDSYRIQHSYFVNKKSPEYKGEWNVPHSVARVYTPEDKAIQTPNSDTPYSFLGADLRAEPIVISVPDVPDDRYYSLQFIDLYTHNFAYVGSRATGNRAGNYLLAGPDWQGNTPPGIAGVIRCETRFAFVIYRTQLFDDADIEEVKRVQKKYQVQTLSRFMDAPPPAPQPPVDFIAPLTPEEQRTSPKFFAILNFLLQYAPTHPSEVDLMARFARHGIGAGKRFDESGLPDADREALASGMQQAWATFAEFKKEQVDTGKRSSADGFGTREFLKNDYLGRMSAAILGIYGNSKDEANYPIYFVDAEGKPLNASANRYTMTFPPGALPPVNSFWSLTMYELPASLLTANPINRYLVNSPMEKDLKRGSDGSVTLYIQHDSPGQDKEGNWLPAPAGPFFVLLREYWPKPEALDGRWHAPPLVRTDR